MGGDFEIVRQGYLIVSIQVVDDGEADAQPFQGVGIQPHLCQVGHTQQLVGRVARIHQRSQQVEQRAYLQGLAGRAYGLHGRVEQRSVHIDHVAGVHGAFQPFLVVGEAHPVLLDDIAGPADGGGAVVAVFGHGISGTRHDKAGAGGDVEGVLVVASRSHNVNRAVVVQVYGDAGREQGGAEAQQLVYTDTSHLVDREQGGYLCVVVLSGGDVLHQPAGFFFGQHFVVEEPGKYFFHRCSC